MIQFFHGSIFDSKCDVIVIPCNAHGGVSASIAHELRLHGLPYPRIDIETSSVTFVDNAGIKELNAQYRNKDIETDVLSFPMGENGVWDKNPETGAYILGDVVISMEKALSQAETYGHSLQRAVGYLTAHSVLHLLGYDHMEPLERVHMREKEELVMEQLGLPASISYIPDNE